MSEKKPRIPFYKSLMFRVCIIVFVAMCASLLVGGIHTYYLEYKNEENKALEEARLIADISRMGIDDDLAQWLYDYWEEHYEELEISIPTDIFENVDTFEKWSESNRDITDIILAEHGDFNYESLKKLSEEQQHKYAEYMYSSLWLAINTMLYNDDSTDYDVLYRVFKPIDNDKAFIYFENPGKNKDVKYLGRVDTFTLDKHPVVTAILESGAEPYKVEHIRSSRDGSSFLYAAWPLTIKGKTEIIVGVLYPWGETRDAMIKRMLSEGGRLLFYLLLADVILIILFNKMILNPVKTLQEHIRDYTKEKDSSDCEKGLADINKRPDEVGSLSRDVTELTREVDRYVKEIYELAEDKAAVGAELSVATRIQADMLPCVFPAFPDRDEFNIFASMTPAKEVGGDFYDFFLLDSDHLCMVMADVSEKGVPSALFMVVARTMIKDQAQICPSPKTILEVVNNKLYENNAEGMFVTVWLGILEISTGKITAVNAGHEYPAIRKAGGSFELIQDVHGMVLGAMPDMKYTEYEIMLEKGGCLFLYTDGVPEATNADTVLFGTDRMIEALNVDPLSEPESLLKNVKKVVDDFVADAPQFDDLTMMAITLR